MKKEFKKSLPISLGKRGQFFILSAVIIATIMVGLVSMKNEVKDLDSHEKFYTYNQQLEKEIAIVVENGIYNDNASRLEEFVQQSVSTTLQRYPGIDFFICYTNPQVKNNLTCQNNGTTNISIQTNTNLDIQKGEIKEVDISSIRSMTVILSNLRGYNITLSNPIVTPLQFYFISKTKTKSGEYVYVSKS